MSRSLPSAPPPDLRASLPRQRSRRLDERCDANSLTTRARDPCCGATILLRYSDAPSLFVAHCFPPLPADSVNDFAPADYCDAYLTHDSVSISVCSCTCASYSVRMRLNAFHVACAALCTEAAQRGLQAQGTLVLVMKCVRKNMARTTARLFLFILTSFSPA